MPAISEKSSKTKQLEGFKTVRSAAMIAYRKLNDEQNRIRRKMSDFDKDKHGNHH